LHAKIPFVFSNEIETDWRIFAAVFFKKISSEWILRLVFFVLRFDCVLCYEECEMHSVMHCFFLLHSLLIGTAIFVTSAPENSFGKFQLAALFASRGSFVYMAYRVK
jgi:hypothetical protein